MLVDATKATNRRDDPDGWLIARCGRPRSSGTSARRHAATRRLLPQLRGPLRIAWGDLELTMEHSSRTSRTPSSTRSIRQPSASNRRRAPSTRSTSPPQGMRAPACRWPSRAARSSPDGLALAHRRPVAAQCRPGRYDARLHDTAHREECVMDLYPRPSRRIRYPARHVPERLPLSALGRRQAARWRSASATCASIT